jgi:uncharacterized iron-regulated membrane protein
MRKGLEFLIKSLRSFRLWHRWTGTLLALFLLISALTGLLLALKKEVSLLQPPTQKGENSEMADWLPLETIDSLARIALIRAHPDQQHNAVHRMDVRPSKRVVKVLFEKGNWEVQIDPGSGKTLSVARRHSDWIEALHDGSIISDTFKLISMNVVGWGLIFLVGSGLWLWYGPRLIRAVKKVGDRN